MKTLLMMMTVLTLAGGNAFAQSEGTGRNGPDRSGVSIPSSVDREINYSAFHSAVWACAPVQVKSVMSQLFRQKVKGTSIFNGVPHELYRGYPAYEGVFKTTLVKLVDSVTGYQLVVGVSPYFTLGSPTRHFNKEGTEEIIRNGEGIAFRLHAGPLPSTSARFIREDKIETLVVSTAIIDLVKELAKPDWVRATSEIPGHIFPIIFESIMLKSVERVTYEFDSTGDKKVLTRSISQYSLQPASGQVDIISQRKFNLGLQSNPQEFKQCVDNQLN